MRKTEPRKNFEPVKHLIRAGETVLEVIVLSLLFSFVIDRAYGISIIEPEIGSRILLLVYVILICSLFTLCDGFKFGHLKLVDVFVTQVICLLITNVVSYLVMALLVRTPLPVGAMLLLTLADIIFAFLLTLLFTMIYHRLFVPKNMLLVYGSDEAVQLKFKMEFRSEKYHISNVISYREGLERVKEAMRSHDAVILNEIPAEERNELLKYSYETGIRTYISPSIPDVILRGADSITLFDTPLFLVRSSGLSLIHRAVKRVLDVFFSALGIIVLSPLFLVIAVAIRIDDGGPVIYRQERVTRNEKRFMIFKFRSMKVGSDRASSPVMADTDDPRVTRVGRVIRKLRLDELPQLFNIFIGDMSIVGPRPECVEFAEKYKAEIPEFIYRYKVKGGLTGYAQVFGKYNTTPYDKLRLDLMYIVNYSLILDFKLVLLTVRTLFRRDSTEGADKKKQMEAQAQAYLQGERTK